MVRQPGNLQVEFAGLKFKNPFLLASASPTLTGEMIANAFEHGWAGAVTKTHKPPSLRRSWVSREPQPMLGSLKYGGRLIGMQNDIRSFEASFGGWAAARLHPGHEATIAPKTSCTCCTEWIWILALT